MHPLRWHYSLACCARPDLHARDRRARSNRASEPDPARRDHRYGHAARAQAREGAGRGQRGHRRRHSARPPTNRARRSIEPCAGLVHAEPLQLRARLAPVVRGFGARGQFGIRGVKVLVDGIPETLPDGLGSVDSIDLGATSQIEVIRGPSSALVRQRVRRRHQPDVRRRAPGAVR